MIILVSVEYGLVSMATPSKNVIYRIVQQINKMGENETLADV